MVHDANSSECPACGGTQPRHIGRLWNLPFDVYHCGKCDRHYAVRAGRDAVRSLNAEERRLATLTVQGRLVKQIARELGVSIRTVAFKRADLMQKLGATNSAELIRLIVESGLLAETEESRNVDFEVTRLHNYQSRIRAPSCFETRREVMNAVAPLRVFVVDDDRDTTECMQLLLRHWGHEVHVANEARLAVEQARFVEPDLMLVDLHMPVLDGLAVARHIRDLPDLAQTTLVAVTGFADARHKEQALDAGFDEYLIKPLPAEVLKSLLNRVGSRVTATRGRSRLSIEAAAISNDQAAEVQRALAEPTVQSPRMDDTIGVGNKIIFVRLEKSGISDLAMLESIGLAEDVRNWLRDQGCRVGPVFEPSPGRAAFYCYSRRQARVLMAGHPRIRLES